MFDVSYYFDATRKRKICINQITNLQIIMFKVAQLKLLYYIKKIILFLYEVYSGKYNNFNHLYFKQIVY